MNLRRLALSLGPPPTLLGWLLAVGLALAGRAQDAAPAARDYCLYVGVSVALTNQSGTYPVIGFDPLNEIILGGDQRRTLSVSQANNLRFLFEPKLGRAPATITRVEHERTGARRGGLEPTAPTAAGRAIDNHFLLSSQSVAAAPPPSPPLVVSFEAASPEPVANAYALGVVTLAVEDGMAETLFFQYIGRLDERPRHVRVHQDGLPATSEVRRIDIHLFTNGEELPTNLSKKRFTITRDEAQDYLIVNHVAKHTGHSLPPTPVWSLAPPSLRAADNGAAFDFPLTVEIDPRGNVTQVRRGALVVPDPIVAIAKAVPFLPALAEGEPVAAVATFNLADYFR